MPYHEDKTLDNDLVDEYFSLCAKLLTGMRQKSHRSEQFNQEVLAKLPRRIQRLPQDYTKITSKDSVYNKAPGRADSTGELNKGLAKNEQEAKPVGVVSSQDQIQDSGASENDNHSQIKAGPYSTIWNPKTDPLHQDKDGWAVLPQFPKYKLANFMTTRAMQLELLNELDDDFGAEWSQADSQLWISTTHAGTGLEDDILGTVETVGSNWVEYDDEEENYCHPGAASIRVLRDWGYSQGTLSQSWFNERLKELWDDSVAFCKTYGRNAKSRFKSQPVWCSLDIDIDLE
jgi:hypothetical protein